MHIQFDPTVAAEREAVAFLLSLLIAPRAAGELLPTGCVQTTVAEAEKAETEAAPKRARRTKEQIAADAAPKAAPQVTPALPAPSPLDPAPLAPVKTLEEHIAAAAAVGPAYTKDDVRAVLSQLAAKDAVHAKAAQTIMAEVGKAARLSDIQPLLYPAVVAAAAAAGMTLDQARAAIAAVAAKG